MFYVEGCFYVQCIKKKFGLRCLTHGVLGFGASYPL